MRNGGWHVAGLMTPELIWWLALGLQVLAVPGVILPVLPGLLWLPLGAGLWCLQVGWGTGWPAFLLAFVIFALGLMADVLAVGLATAKQQASRWALLGAGAGVLIGLVSGGVALLLAPWLGAALVEVWSLGSRAPDLAWGARLSQAARVGLAVVVALLVSQVAQVLLALIGVTGFVILTVR